MLTDLPVEVLLGRIAAVLEEELLPALTGAAERRECRAATYLLRGIAGALPTLSDVLAADVAEFGQVVGRPASACEREELRALRDALAAELSALLAQIPPGTQDSEARSASRRSLDRWIALFPPTEALGEFVTLANEPIVTTATEHAS